MKYIELDFTEFIDDYDYELNFFRNYDASEGVFYDDFELKLKGYLVLDDVYDAIKEKISNENIIDTFKIVFIGTLEIDGLEFEFKGKPVNGIFTEENLVKIRG